MLPVSLIFTSGVASGVNSYAAVLVLGLLGRFWHIAAIPAVLERPSVLAAAAVLYVGQFVVGKVPMLDSVWDVVHTPPPCSTRRPRQSSRPWSWRPASLCSHCWPRGSAGAGSGAAMLACSGGHPAAVRP